MTFGHQARDESGQSLIEFALVSTVFLTVLFGTIEFGVGIWRYNMVADLAQEGVRWAAVHGNQSTSPASTTDVQTYVQSRSPGFTVTVTTTPSAPSALGPGLLVTVLVQTTYTPLTGLIPTSTMTFQSTATMTMSR